MAKQIIDARIKQKTGTFEEWDNNPLILLDGEVALVRTATGAIIQQRVGDGYKTFAELPDNIRYDQSAFIQVNEPSKVTGNYTVVGAGTYSGVTVGADKIAVLYWNGTGWVKNFEGDLPKVDVIDGFSSTAKDKAGSADNDRVLKNDIDNAKVQLPSLLIANGGDIEISSGTKYLKFFSAISDITLQRVNLNGDGIIRFYKWANATDYTVIEVKKSEMILSYGTVYYFKNATLEIIIDWGIYDTVSFGGIVKNNYKVLNIAFEESIAPPTPIVNVVKDCYLYASSTPTHGNVPSFNTTTRILTIPGQNVMLENAGFVTATLSEVDLSVGTYNIFVIYFDNTSKTFKALANNVTTVPDNYYKFGMIYRTTGVYSVNSPFFKVNDDVQLNYVSNNLLTDYNNRITALESSSTVTPASAKKLVMGKNLYCIDGEKLPIYKSSLNTDVRLRKLCFIQKISEWPRLGEINFKYPKYHYFEDVFEFDSTDSPSTATLAVVEGTENVITAIRGIKVNRVTKQSLNAKSIKYMPFGASNTGFGFGRVVAEYLKQFNCAVTTLGVLNQGGSIDGVQCKGEGRGGWGYLTYIGKKPNNQGSWITYPNSSETNFTTTMNPFMKPATESDKLNHPDYCFPDYTHAGKGGASSLEVPSLKQIQDASGDVSSYGVFYIFDFSWYLTARSIQAPDTITIQLGLNDSPAVTASQFALPFILNSITNAVSGIKIGICPSPAVQQSVSGDAYVDSYNSYNNWLNDFLVTYNNSNVTVLNLSLSMNRQFDFAFNSVSSTKLYNDGNLTEGVNVTDNSEFGGQLHSDNNGFMEIGKCIGAYVANCVV